MYFSTLTIAALAVAAGVSAAPAQGMKNGLRARSGPGSEIVVGVIDYGNGDFEPLTMTLEDISSGSLGFNSLVYGATSISSDIATSSNKAFSSASCSFTATQEPTDAEGRVTCDLSTKVADVFSTDSGYEIYFSAPAGCVFCEFNA